MDVNDPTPDSAQDELDPGDGACYQAFKAGWHWPDLFWWLR